MNCFLRNAHLVDPAGQAGSFGDVLKDDGAGINEPAGCDGAFLLVVLRRGLNAGGDAAGHSGFLARFLIGILWLRRGAGGGLGSCDGTCNQEKKTTSETANAQKTKPP